MRNIYQQQVGNNIARERKAHLQLLLNPFNSKLIMQILPAIQEEYDGVV